MLCGHWRVSHWNAFKNYDNNMWTSFILCGAGMSVVCACVAKLNRIWIRILFKSTQHMICKCIFLRSNAIGKRLEVYAVNGQRVLYLKYSNIHFFCESFGFLFCVRASVGTATRMNWNILILIGRQHRTLSMHSCSGTKFKKTKTKSQIIVFARDATDVCVIFGVVEYFSANT